MLFEVLKYLKNFFPVDGQRKKGEITIENGTVSLDFLKSGQYFLIEGSVFNDGVYKYPCTDLTDETFEGCVTGLAVPAAVIAITEEIAAWQTANASNLSSPYASESFGGYSYSRATNADGSSLSWKDVFRGRLNDWRKK